MLAPLSAVSHFTDHSIEHSVHDALCVMKRVLESHLVVPGGGAVETALSVYLENFARTLVSVVGWAGGWGRRDWWVVDSLVKSYRLGMDIGNWYET